MPTTARQTNRLSRLAKGGILVLASSVLTLALGEAVLRALSRDAFYVWPPGLRQRFHPSPGIMPGVSGPSRFEVSSLGLRGDELAEGRDLRFLALGGSTTECLYLDQAEAWPQLLQRRLGPRAWVGNAGRSGSHTRHHRIQAERLLGQLPRMDAVIVLTGVNDLSVRLSQDAAWAPVDLRTREARTRVLQEAFEIRPLRFEEGSFYKRTALWQALRKLARLRTAAAVTQDDAGRVYQLWRRYRREAPALRGRLPDLGPALAEYAENLRVIARAAARHGARTVFVTQPVLWQAGLPADLQRLLWMGGVGRFQSEPGHEYYSTAALAAGMDAYNRVLLATCREIPGAVCVDLADRLPRDTTVFYDDVHFNEAGSRRVAELLAEVLAPSAPSPPSAGRVQAAN